MADEYEESIDKLSLLNILLEEENKRLGDIIISLESRISVLEQTKKEMKLQLDLATDLGDKRWKELEKIKKQYSFDRYTADNSKKKVDNK